MSAWTWAVDGWIIAIGALCALSCAIPGAFLVVRRTSMLADAISHAVLPGIAVAFLLSGTRDPLWMFIGAATAGLMVTLVSSALTRIARIDSGAALGLTFTTAFALGLILIVQVADTVDLDPSCVLYGAIELAPLDSTLIGGVELPRAVIVLGAVTLLNALVALCFWKELTLMAFDPALAKTLGCRPKLMESIILGMAAATCVAAFESVGSILVVAMMIIPAATGRLFSDRLVGVIVGAIIIGFVGAISGHWVATTVAPAIIAGGRDASSAGSIAATLGVLLVIAIIIAPRRGIVVRAIHRWRLTLRIAREDAIGLLWRLEEDHRTVAEVELRTLLVLGAEIPGWLARVALIQLARDGRVDRSEAVVRLTDRGRGEGASLVRSHRLWEIYLMQRLALARDHVHPTAMVLEHITDAAMRARLAREDGATGDGAQPLADPHGRTVPAAINPRDHSV
ncbi:MAG: iron ABC transporter [Phycisphaerales bacterium]|nr:iron ABC transporter [Phycisphaerales bacterium]